MTSPFPIVHLGDIAIIRGGKRLPRGADFSPTDTANPYIRARDIKGGRVTFEDPVFLTSDVAAKLQRYTVNAGDICIVIVGANVGDTGAVPQRLHGANLTENAVKVIAAEGTDLTFLKYALLTDNAQRQMKVLAGGSAQPKLGIYKVETVEIPHLPHSSQRKIASILSAYDDLIENNLLRIHILEEMAEALYREWFVEFRFPGHERTALVDSEMGRVPSGWDVTTVDDTFEINGGGTPSKKQPEYWDGGSVTWYSPSDLTRAGSMFMDKSQSQITELGLKKSSARLFPPFSVMLTSRATVGVVAINTTPACTNQGFINCIPNDAFPVYVLYFWMRECTDTIVSMASGATFMEISKSVFKTIPLLKPPLPLVTQFQQTVEPLGLQILNLQRRNAKSRETRDLLLPRLISGHVDVSNLDIGVGEAA